MILFEDFLNVVNEEKLTILGGKLFRTFTTRSLKTFSACWCDSSLPTTWRGCHGLRCGRHWQTLAGNNMTCKHVNFLKPRLSSKCRIQVPVQVLWALEGRSERTVGWRSAIDFVDDLTRSPCMTVLHSLSTDRQHRSNRRHRMPRGLAAPLNIDSLQCCPIYRVNFIRLD